LSTLGVIMTEQELKEQIRERIHRDLGVIPDWVWEHYWNLSVVREYIEDDTGFERDIMGDDGEIYVNQMKTVLETLNTVTPHDVPSFSLSRNRQQPTPHEEMLRPPHAQDIADMIELWWSVLPERDKQAITQSWEFAYNLLDAFAPTFWEWYAGKSVLTPEETRQWFTKLFPAEVLVLGNAENPPTHEVYIAYKPRFSNYVVPFADGTIYSIRSDVWSAQAFLLIDMNTFATHWGMTLSVVLRCLLTGERVPPRLVCTFFGQPQMHLTPVFPPYLSAEAVARVWSTVRFSGSPKSWSLSRCSLGLFRSYAEALQAWNRVTPEDWRIPDYRVFHKEWTRAQKRAFNSWFRMPAPSSRTGKQEEESPEQKLAMPFFPFRPQSSYTCVTMYF
jgi:hypothetical protein